MEPIAWGNAPLLDVSPAQNLLAHQGHHYGMIHVMVGCITIGNIFQSEAPNESNDVRIGWFEDAIDLAVHISKLLDKRLDDNLCGVEHDRLPNSQMLVRFEHAVTDSGRRLRCGADSEVQASP